jgi:hypothetical protein
VQYQVGRFAGDGQTGYNQQGANWVLQEMWVNYSDLSLKSYGYTSSGVKYARYGVPSQYTGCATEQVYNHSDNDRWSGVQTVYQYRDKQYVTQTTYYFQKPVWSDWSSWSTTYQSSSSTKEVETRQSYVY